MAKRKSMKGLGRDIYFEDTSKEGKEGKQVNHFTNKQVKQQISLERGTFYIWPEQQEGLEELKIKLRSKMRQQREPGRRQIDKSELVRLALDLLTEQDEEILIKRLTSKEF